MSSDSTPTGSASPLSTTERESFPEPLRTPTSPQGPRAQSEPPPWFADLRSKVAAFSMSAWLSSLGMKKAPGTSQSADDIASRLQPQPPLEDISPRRRQTNGEGSEAREEPESSTGAEASEEDGGRLVRSLVTETGEEEGEPWELPAFWLNLEPGRNYNDTLQLQHFGPLEGLVPSTSSGHGKGHSFQPSQLSNPTWCDKFGDFIWGFYRQAVVCEHCRFTCHAKCEGLVTLDCRRLSDSDKSADRLSFHSALEGTELSATRLKSLEDDDTESQATDGARTEVTELEGEMGELGLGEEAVDGVQREAWLVSLPNGAELAALLEAHNKDSPASNFKASSDGNTFTGHLSIAMNFTRPINVVGTGPASLYDVVAEDTLVPPGAKARTITSFYLPRNTRKTVHLTSDTTALELIVLLLRKFKVADCPRKFALYTRPHCARGGTLKAALSRIADDACPLRLALCWGPVAAAGFVLQENDTGDILWDAFEIPELSNFLRILDLEEAQYSAEIRQKFASFRRYLAAEIRAKGGSTDGASPRSEGSAPDPPPLKEAKGPRDFGDFPTLCSDDLDGPLRAQPASKQGTLDSQQWGYYTGTL